MTAVLARHTIDRRVGVPVVPQADRGRRGDGGSRRFPQWMWLSVVALAILGAPIVSG